MNRFRCDQQRIDVDQIRTTFFHFARRLSIGRAGRKRQRFSAGETFEFGQRFSQLEPSLVRRRLIEEELRLLFAFLPFERQLIVFEGLFGKMFRFLRRRRLKSHLGRFQGHRSGTMIFVQGDQHGLIEVCREKLGRSRTLRKEIGRRNARERRNADVMSNDFLLRFRRIG